MLMKNMLKASFALLCFISLFSCSEDLTIIPDVEEDPSMFMAVLDGDSQNPFLAFGDAVDAYTTTIEYDFNDEDNNVISTGSYEAVRILGTNGVNSLALVFPGDIVEGSYQFSDTQGFYLANYMSYTTEGLETNRAKSGTLVISLHNSEAHYVEGYFEFETLENTVTAGEFRSFYSVNE